MVLETLSYPIESIALDYTRIISIPYPIFYFKEVAVCDQKECPWMNFEEKFTPVKFDINMPDIVLRKEPSKQEISNAIVSLCSLIRPATVSSASKFQKRCP